MCGTLFTQVTHSKHFIFNQNNPTTLLYKKIPVMLQTGIIQVYKIIERGNINEKNHLIITLHLLFSTLQLLLITVKG